MFFDLNKIAADVHVPESDGYNWLGRDLTRYMDPEDAELVREELPMAMRYKAGLIPRIGGTLLGAVILAGLGQKKLYGGGTTLLDGMRFAGQNARSSMRRAAHVGADLRMKDYAAVAPFVTPVALEVPGAVRALRFGPASDRLDTQESAEKLLATARAKRDTDSFGEFIGEAHRERKAIGKEMKGLRKAVHKGKASADAS
jgi:hypothetical protein